MTEELIQRAKAQAFGLEQSTGEFWDRPGCWNLRCLKSGHIVRHDVTEDWVAEFLRVIEG